MLQGAQPDPRRQDAKAIKPGDPRKRPDTGLVQARTNADNARKLLAAGTAPSATRNASKEAQAA